MSKKKKTKKVSEDELGEIQTVSSEDVGSMDDLFGGDSQESAEVVESGDSVESTEETQEDTSVEPSPDTQIDPEPVTDGKEAEVAVATEPAASAAPVEETKTTDTLLEIRRDYWRGFRHGRSAKWPRISPEKDLLARIAREAKRLGFYDAKMSDFDVMVDLAKQIDKKMNDEKA